MTELERRTDRERAAYFAGFRAAVDAIQRALEAGAHPVAAVANARVIGDQGLEAERREMFGRPRGAPPSRDRMLRGGLNRGLVLGLVAFALAAILAFGARAATPVIDSKYVRLPDGTTLSAAFSSGNVSNTRVLNTASFVGSIACPTAIPSSGTVDNCIGQATTFNSVSLGTGNYVELSGTYTIANPSATSGGFKVIAGMFGQACGSGAPCGAAFKTFQQTLRDFAATYQTGYLVTGAKPIIRFRQGVYFVDPTAPFFLRGAGWTLDFSTSPEFRVATNAASSVATMAGTGQISISGTGSCGAGVPNSTCIVVTGGNFCGSGNCWDGDSTIRAGDVIKIGSAAWKDAGVDQVFVVRNLVDSTHIQVAPPATANVSAGSALAASTGRIWEVDNTSYSQSGGVLEAYSPALEMIGVPRLTCTSLCQNVNPFASGGARTSGGGYRTVPLEGFVTRHSWPHNRAIIGPLCGKNDAELVIVAGDQDFSTSQTCTFDGHLAPCGEWNESLYQIQGEDPNSNTDDGIGSLIRQGAPNFVYEGENTANVGRFLFAYGNVAGSYYTTHVENAAQLAWFPEGAQNVVFRDMSVEQRNYCGAGGQVACDLAAARRPWIQIDTWTYRTNDTTLASYAFESRPMFGETRPLTFLKVTDPYPVDIYLDTGVGTLFTTKALDIANNKTRIHGHLVCSISASSTACDRPSAGSFDDFFVTDLVGTLFWTSHRLDGEYPLFAGRVRIPSGSSSGNCFRLGGAPTTASGLEYSACGTTGVNQTSIVVDHAMTITRMSFTLDTATASNDGCDFRLMQNGSGLGSDNPYWPDIGYSTLRSANQNVEIAQGWDVSAGDRIEVQALEPQDATQCLAGSSCDCTSLGGDVAGRLTIWARNR